MREGEIIEAEVQRLGTQGDGVAMAENKLLFVPLVVPGEKVKVKVGRSLGDGYMAELVEITMPSDQRAVPACAHFAQCGGCSLQHLAAKPYKAHKRDVILGALRQHHLTDIEVREPLVMPAGTRRRLSMAAMYTKNGVIIGFNARASHNVVDIKACPVARPELIALLPQLRIALAPWLSKAKTLGINLTYTGNGIDILITGPEPDMAGREAMSLLSNIGNLARISWRASERVIPEPMMGQRDPVISFAGTPVLLPPNNFLQASAEGETTLTQLVKGAVRECKGKIADLFAGLGTFSLPLAQQANVLAVEADKHASAALKTAVGPHGKIEVQTRDLFREPLTPLELKGFDAVVFDPPRAGAQTQCAELAQSNVPVIVAVSCNPGTFARDAETLIKGGYKCEWVQPVDQFLWSSHVELVARFVKL